MAFPQHYLLQPVVDKGNGKPPPKVYLYRRKLRALPIASATLEIECAMQ